MAEIRFFRWGSPSDRTMNTILKPIPGVNGSNYKGYHEKLMDHFRDVQSQTVSYLLVSMQQLVELVGRGTWNVATTRERKALLLRLFNKAKCTIARNTFKSESSAVDFENIFCRVDDERKLWQNVVRTEFANLALKTYDFRIDSDNDNALFELYKDLMSSEAFTRLNLGPVGNVLGRIHRPVAGGGREAKATTARVSRKATPRYGPDSSKNWHATSFG